MHDKSYKLLDFYGRIAMDFHSFVWSEKTIFGIFIAKEFKITWELINIIQIFYNGTYVDVDILSILFTLQKISYSSADFLYRQYHAYVYMSVHALYVGTR